MKKVTIMNVVLFGLCAALWIAKFVFEMVSKTYVDKPFRLVLDVACCVLFTACFIIYLVNYLSNKKQ